MNTRFEDVPGPRRGCREGDEKAVYEQRVVVQEILVQAFQLRSGIRRRQRRTSPRATAESCGCWEGAIKRDRVGNTRKLHLEPHAKERDVDARRIPGRGYRYM